MTPSTGFPSSCGRARVRAFDVDAMMTGCELVDGREVEAAIERLFANPKAEYLHVHFAAPGCYAAQVERA